MPDKPRYYPQEENCSCGPACLHMVLDALGTFKSEEELRHLSHCTEEGAFPEDLVDAARNLGFDVRAEKYSNFDKLKLELDSGIYPIVLLRVRSSPYISVHTVVVVEISDSEVQVFDPDPKWRECSYSKIDFWREWSEERRYAILISRSKLTLVTNH